MLLPIQDAQSEAVWMLVLRRLPDGVDHEDFDGTLRGLEAQAELFLAGR
jgi:hypothetical protein